MILLGGKKKILLTYKPSGVLCNQIKNKKNLQTRVSQIFKDTFWPVNRLDKMAEGWIMYSNSERIIKKIKKEWICSLREYWVICKNSIPLKTYTFYCRKIGNRTEYKWKYFDRATRCTSHVMSIVKLNNWYAVKVKNSTGFTHQIRVLVRLLGSYVIGDLLYKKKQSKVENLLLAATKLKVSNLTLNERKYVFHAESTLSTRLKYAIIKDFRNKYIDQL